MLLNEQKLREDQKELALQAALRETEPGQIGKQVRDLMKLDYTKDESYQRSLLKEEVVKQLNKRPKS